MQTLHGVHKEERGALCLFTSIPQNGAGEKTLRPPAVAHLRAGDDSPKLSTETG